MNALQVIATRARRLADALQRAADARQLSDGDALQLACDLDALTLDVTALNGEPVASSVRDAADAAARRAQSLHLLTAGWRQRTPDLYAIESAHRYAAAVILCASRLRRRTRESE